jgi:hypothetical protein
MLNKKDGGSSAVKIMLVKEKRKQNGRSRFGRRLLISEITRLQKKRTSREKDNA